MRAYARFQGTRVAMWLSRTFVWKLDPIVLRLTGGRLGLAFPLPNALLETTGARSGLPRRHGVIYFHDGHDVILVPSRAGAPVHPAWFHNAVAHPDVHLNGLPFRAAVVEGETERDRLWAQADLVFPAYERYRAMAAETGRTIPILRLTPR